MKRMKTTLFLATVASSALISSAAQAQTLISVTPATNDGDAKLHGTGATSIQRLLVQELNCIGDFQQLGSSSGSLTTVAEPTNLPTPSGTFNCSTTELQPNFVARYVGSGSGLGRTAWRNTGTNAFTGTNVNPFATSPSPWTKVQFAFADSSVTDSDLTTYTGGLSRSRGGEPIQFPKYVLPVAIGYNGVYGTKGGTNFSFNVATPATVLGTNVGGLRLSRATYCGVFNGQITNFNNASFTTDNGGTSLKAAADAVARWNTDGVPVRLVGRLDRSGTTDIFTRALAAQCNGLGYTNKFVQNAETLPYWRAGVATNQAPDFQAIRNDTGLRAASTDAQAGANTAATNAVSRDYFDPATSTITDSGVTGGGTQSDPVVNGSGNFVGSGLFIVADGSTNVGNAIALAPEIQSPTDTAFLLNGKLGYIGSDFITGSPTAITGLFSAALQNNTSGAWEVPSAAAATTAFGSVLPPESTSAGVFADNADTRTVTIPTYQGGGTGNAQRQNPLAWVQVLYVGANNLSNPSVGYPITGTTQFLGYTCYAAGNREHVVNFLGWNTEGVTRQSNNANRTGIFSTVGTTRNNSGLLIRSNIGTLPSAWRNAITQTFLTDSTQAAATGDLGDLNLWIQSTPIPGGTANGSANGCGGGKVGI